MEKLLQQIEEWNEAGEYSKAIETIEALSEEERGYPLILWLGRLMSNLAVMGEGDIRARKNMEPDWKLLRRSIALLETIREKGEADPLWHSRMAYALRRRRRAERPWTTPSAGWSWPRRTPTPRSW